MKLTMRDRLTLPVPVKDTDYLTGIIVRDICKKLEPTEKEKDVMTVREDGKGWDWDEEFGKIENAFTFTNTELRVMKDYVNRLDKEKKLSQFNISICEKIKNEENKDT